jgi:glycosyltransferase involved in cell wall biosynthesis
MRSPQLSPSAQQIIHPNQKERPMLSLIIPIYKNEANIPSLLDAIADLQSRLGTPFEAVFVVDGSPDESLMRLREALPQQPYAAQLLALSRNFGAFAAMRAGLAAGNGDFFAVMAADLQEPPELVLEMHSALVHGNCDVAYGKRTGRADPWVSRMLSAAFWGFYRRTVAPDIPKGGVDMFACTRDVRDQVLALNERNSSLVGLLFWVGYRRQAIPYARREREIGTSAWSFAKKWQYMQDSVFSFSDLPITLLLVIGFLGTMFSGILAITVFFNAITGQIDVPGYAATIIVILFLGALQLLSMGVLGIYIWRVFENTKGRPLHIVMQSQSFAGTSRVDTRSTGQ